MCARVYEDSVLTCFLLVPLYVFSCVPDLVKWKRAETDPGILSTIDKIAELNVDHSQAYLDFVAAQGEYVAALKTIAANQEELNKLNKQVKDLEGQLAKGKASQGQLNGAKEERDQKAKEVNPVNAKTYHDAVVALTKAQITMYKEATIPSEKLLAFLESSEAQPGQEPVAPGGGAAEGDAEDLPPPADE